MAATMDERLFRVEDFFHHVTLTVLFSDVDMMGHVNHAKYLSYMEQGRISYVRDILRWDGDLQHLGMILARAVVDYKSPLKFGEQVVVSTRCVRLGNKSFEMAAVLRRQKQGELGDMVATGLMTIVAYDYQQEATMPVPDEWRQRVMAFEKAFEA